MTWTKAEDARCLAILNELVDHAQPTGENNMAESEKDPPEGAPDPKKASTPSADSGTREPKKECIDSKKDDKKDVVARSVAILGLIVSGANVYFTQFQPADLSVFVAPTMSVYYQKNGSLGVHVPVGFTNSSGRGGAILRARLFLGRGKDKLPYEQEWTGFSDTSSQTIKESDVIPVAVAATSVVGKIIQFKWPSDPHKSSDKDTDTTLLLTPGHYTFELRLWTADTDKPGITIRKPFTIDTTDWATLSERRQQRCNAIWPIAFDTTPPAKVASHPDPVLTGCAPPQESNRPPPTSCAECPPAACNPR